MPVEKTSRLWFLVGVSLWFVFAVNVSAADCNFNGIDDMEDINSASSEDCNESGIPDECELAPFAFGSRDRGIELDTGDIARDYSVSAASRELPLRLPGFS